MASESTTENITVTSQERTWRVQIECPFEQDYVLQAFRETVRTVDGDLFGDPNKGAGVVTRALSQVRTDTVTLGSGKTVSIIELAEALVKHIEAWREADLEPQVPAPIEEEETEE